MFYDEDPVSYDFVSTKKPKRLGLLSNLTGVPIFILYHVGLKATENYYFTSLEEINEQQRKEGIQWNKDSWALLHPFFECGGSQMIVVTSPVQESSLKNEADLLADFIGSDKSYTGRTGVYNLRGLSDKADLVCIPQACQKLGNESLETFYKMTFALLDELSSFFMITDMPIGFSKDEYMNWSTKILSANAAIFYPWLYKDDTYSPPCVIIAAIIQKNDADFSISDCIANRSLQIPWRPVVVETPSVLRMMQNTKLNILHVYGQGDFRIIGDHTLSSDKESANRLMASRRALKAIERALNSICEAYVLEPLSSQTENKIQMDIVGFCTKMSKLFNPLVREPFQVKVKIEHVKEHEVINVDCSFSLPHALDKIPLYVNVSN